jgi:sugar lactone lactonase YvrE
MSGLLYPDGLTIDQDRSLLYVAHLTSKWVTVYNIEQDAQVNGFYAHNMTMIDDICVSESGNKIYAADYWRGDIISINAETGKEYKLIQSGFVSPTSVRIGGNGFNKISLFVTEGGSFSRATMDRNVLEIVDVL